MGVTSLMPRFQEPAGWQWGSMKSTHHTLQRYGGLLPEGPVLAHVIYIEGLSEFAEKTFELASDFNKESCGFWVMDRVGQALSGRYLADAFKQHSLGFHNDARDIMKFIRTVIPDDGRPVILLGHSTGGPIALLVTHDAPDLAGAAVLTGPLLGFQNPVVRGRERLFAHIPPIPRLLERFILNGHPWRPRTHPHSEMKPEDFSSDPQRMHVHDYWQKKKPELRVGSPTFGWLKSACRAAELLRDPAYLREIQKPVMVFTAGHDRLVNNERTLDAVAHLPQVSYTHFHNGKHELLMETDNIRSYIIRSVADLAKTLPPRPRNT